jgi:uncharacterized protein YqgC (DUF456 family)
MTSGELVLLGLGMLTGLIGVLVPLLPGSLLIAALCVVWLFADGPGPGHWVAALLVLAILAAGSLAKYALPSHALRGVGAPKRTLALGVLAAIAGFFVIPVLGAPVGFVAGVFAGEYARLHGAGPAWASARSTLAAIGLGMLLELTAATLAVAVWVVSVVLLHR